MNKSLRLAAVLGTTPLGMCLAHPVNAALLNGSIEFDGLTYGTVVDTVSNREWLDLDATVSATPAAAEAFFGSAGFRWANFMEVSDMMDNFFKGFDPSLDPGIRPTSGASSQSFINPGVAGTFVSLFGNLAVRGSETAGLYDDLDPTDNDLHGFGLRTTFGGLIVDARTIGSDRDLSGNRFDGVFLVRDSDVVAPPSNGAVVPTPALLPGLVGFGMSALRKKRKSMQTA